MTLTAAIAVIAWGALAFGAVYPWAYTPLLAACAATGLFALAFDRRMPASRSTGRAMAALGLTMAAGALQIVPLPAPVLATVSPGTHAFLQTYDLTYAYAGSAHPLSVAPRSTWIGLGFLAALGLFLAGLTRALSPSRVRRMAALIVGFGVVLALIGIAQKAVLGDHAWGGMKIYGVWTPENLLSTPFGPYINKNHFAGWMLMAIPVALGLAIGRAEVALRHLHGGRRAVLLWLGSPEGGRLQLTALAVLTMTASLLMTRSRSGVACLVFAMILMSVAVKRRFGSVRAGGAALASLAAVFLVVFSMAGADLAARITNRIDAMELRKNIWSDSARAIRDFPVAGTGLNTFGTAMIAYQSTQKDQHFQEAHNDYLQVIVEGGLLLSVPAAAALFLFAAAIRKRFAAAADDAQTWWVRAGAVVGLLTIAAQAFVEFSLQMPGNAVLFVVLLAMALHEAGTRRVRTRGAGEGQ